MYHRPAFFSFSINKGRCVFIFHGALCIITPAFVKSTSVFMTNHYSIRVVLMYLFNSFFLCTFTLRILVNLLLFKCRYYQQLKKKHCVFMWLKIKYSELRLLNLNSMFYLVQRWEWMIRCSEHSLCKDFTCKVGSLTK